MILAIVTYIACVIFLGRFAWHVLSWARAARNLPTRAFSKKASSGIIAETLLDIILFRRLFRTNKLLWAASWTFHACLLLVVLRHLRYFMYPVPGVIISVQPAGLYAGYVLPFSLLLILIMRITILKDRYVSFYNYYLITVLFLISSTGVLMETSLRTNLVDIKAYILGIVSFAPGSAPGSFLFIVHFILVLLLISSLPFHLIAAPIVTMVARRREDELDMVLHEK